MLQCFLCLFMIYVSLVTEVKCESSIDEWEIFTIDSLDLTLDFEDNAKLASILDQSCNITKLTFEFEVDWDELVSKALSNPLSTDQYLDSSTSKRENQTKIAIIVVCTMAAVVVAVLLYVYLKRVLMTYLQSGTYNVPETNTRGQGFHELPEVKLRNNYKCRKSHT